MPDPLDIAVLVDDARIISTTLWWLRECVPALAEAGHNVCAAAIGGVRQLPLPRLEVSDIGHFVDRSHAPVLVEVDGTTAPRSWSLRSKPMRVPVAVALPPVDGAWFDWPPVVRADSVAYRPSQRDAFVWRGTADPAPLYAAMSRGALVFATVRDRWTEWAPDCFVYVNPKTEDVDMVVADFLADADECRRLTRRAREFMERLTAARFAASFDAACQQARKETSHG